ncbi:MULTISPECIES: papain fold toxin domain-containing protein [unclassified Spirulina]|uniref:papain fold toxin domain-containing protein n=1 Tax=unclassified Spirulina TaxID=2684457 RepID=UPI00194DB383|nr:MULTISPECIES: papain fold toxin domain-containing protein [Spirulina]MEA5471789.1 papain fold toxin domain-containing protein [Spirulina sp. 06S082]
MINKHFVWQEVKKITVNYPVMECDRCAIAVCNWLKTQKIPYKIVRLKTKRRSDYFIVSQRYGMNDTITENGTHYGVAVFDLIFDNLSGEGLTRDDWLADFSCRSGQFIIDELDSLGD